jgi:hypothetical protein
MRASGPVAPKSNKLCVLSELLREPIGLGQQEFIGELFATLIALVDTGELSLDHPSLPPRARAARRRVTCLRSQGQLQCVDDLFIYPRIFIYP